jgi:hypothetical protein
MSSLRTRGYQLYLVRAMGEKESATPNRSVGSEADKTRRCSRDPCAFTTQAGEFSMLRTKLTDIDAVNRALMTENNSLKDEYRKLQTRYEVDVFKATVKTSAAPIVGRSWGLGGAAVGTGQVPNAGASTSIAAGSTNSLILGR